MRPPAIELCPSAFDSALVSVRYGGGEIRRMKLGRMSLDVLGSARPWRTFRNYKGQRHYSGAYWASTEGAHVIHESRLELGVLMAADFDPAVLRIFAQPFNIRIRLGGDGPVRHHVPDYLLLTDHGPVVVAVKPRAQLEEPVNVEAFAWMREVMGAKGWRFEVATDQPPVYLENLRFLAGYRRKELISQPCLDTLRGVDLDGTRFGDVLRRVGGSSPLMRAALLHMLWTHEIAADLHRVLSAGTVLRRAVE